MLQLSPFCHDRRTEHAGMDKKELGAGFSYYEHTTGTCYTGTIADAQLQPVAKVWPHKRKGWIYFLQFKLRARLVTEFFMAISYKLSCRNSDVQHAFIESINIQERKKNPYIIFHNKEFKTNQISFL